MIIWERVDLTKIHPTLVEHVNEMFAGSAYTFYVLEGYRSLKRSKELWEDFRFGKVDPKTGKRNPNNPGPRAAPPGRSAHNFGCAVDVVLDVDPVKPGLQPSWMRKLPGWVWLIAKCEVNPYVENLWHIGDAPHIQLRNWRAYKDWRVFPEA